GRGEADFERAKLALSRWRQFELGWVELFPRGASIETGTTVAILVRHPGFYSLHGCRVVFQWEDSQPEDYSTFGFIYGTLTNHAEIGEEAFEVTFSPESGEVEYRILAASRPRAALAKIGYPLTRMLQAKFRRDSIAAMRRAISD